MSLDHAVCSFLALFQCVCVLPPWVASPLSFTLAGIGERSALLSSPPVLSGTPFPFSLARGGRAVAAAFLRGHLCAPARPPRARALLASRRRRLVQSSCRHAFMFCTRRAMAAAFLFPCLASWRPPIPSAIGLIHASVFS